MEDVNFNNYLRANSSEERMKIVATAFKLIKELDTYIKLLDEELNEVVPMAAVHGWKSTRYEQGESQRMKIQKYRAIKLPQGGGTV